MDLLHHQQQHNPGDSSSLFRHRRQRQFIPDSRKDVTYWDRRRRNNEAAKRSREKRRINDMLLEVRVQELDRENAALRAQLDRANAELARFKSGTMVMNNSEETEPFSPYPPDMLETRYPNLNIEGSPLNLTTGHYPDSPPPSDSSPPPSSIFSAPQDLSLPHKLRFKRKMSLSVASDDGNRSRYSVDSFSTVFESGVIEDNIKKET